jgi:hypothetical protein
VVTAATRFWAALHNRRWRCIFDALSHPQSVLRSTGQQHPECAPGERRYRPSVANRRMPPSRSRSILNLSRFQRWPSQCTGRLGRRGTICADRREAADGEDPRGRHLSPPQVQELLELCGTGWMVWLKLQLQFQRIAQIQAPLDSILSTATHSSQPRLSQAKTRRSPVGQS